jgi:SH3-like domain-containing protein
MARKHGIAMKPWLILVPVMALVLAVMPAAGPAQGQTSDTAAKPAEGAEETDPQQGGLKPTGLPLPRFASLRASEVFMRTGPGTRYPVEWIYRRRDLPVQIIAEFDTWRKVRDWNGAVGWVHRAMLSGRRTAITVDDETVLRRAPDMTAPAVARAESGVIARILSCDGAWCRVDAGGMKGWTPRRALWGTFADEKVD